MLSGYKRTIALLAGIKLGVFNELLNKKQSLYELSQNLSANQEMLNLLLDFYISEGIVTYSEGFWQLTKDFNLDDNKLVEIIQIAEHEENIYRNWNTVDNIVDSIKKGLNHRLFDIQGFGVDSLDKYNKAMYGKNIEIISFWIKRSISHLKNISLLEFGRSPGVIADCLMRQRINIKADVAVFDNLFDITTKNIGNPDIEVFKLSEFKIAKIYNAVILLNTVHYYNRLDMKNSLELLHSNIESDAILCIADLFYSKSSQFSSGILIDWITHGGVNFIYIEEIIDILKDTGFNIIKINNLSDIATDLIICTKK